MAKQRKRSVDTSKNFRAVYSHKLERLDMKDLGR